MATETQQIGVPLVSGNTIYVLREGGFRRGEMTYENEWDMHVQSHPYSLEKSEAIADRVRDCLVACEGIYDPAALRRQRDMLLEACKAALPYVIGAYECAFPNESENDSVAEQIRTAIAAAEGESHA